MLTNIPPNPNFIRLIVKPFWVFLKLQLLFHIDWLTQGFSPQYLQTSDAFKEVFASWKLDEKSYQFYLVWTRLISLAVISYILEQHTSCDFEPSSD